MLAPDLATVKTDVAAFVTSQTQVLAGAHAVLTTELATFTPTPDWYDGISKILTAVKAQATSWVETEEPSIVSQVMQGFIDMSNTFGPVAVALEPLIAQIIADQDGEPTSSQRQELRGLLSAISDTARQQQAIVQNADKELQLFMVAVNEAVHQLRGGAASIAGDINADEAKIAAVKERIDSIRQKIAADSEAAKTSILGDVFIVISLVVVIAGVVASEGALLPLLGLGLGLANFGRVIGDAIVWSDDVEKDFNLLIPELRKLNDLERQVTTLNVIESSIEGLGQSVSMTSDALPRFETVWDVFVGSLGCSDLLLQQPHVDIRLVPDLQSIADANQSWIDAAHVAGNVQQSFGNITPAKIELPPQKT